jgi:hypothetical protein
MTTWTNRLAEWFVFAMFGLTLFYIPFELFGPLQYKSLQIKDTYDPRLLMGLTLSEFGFLLLALAVVGIVLLMLPVIKTKGADGKLVKAFRWRVSVSTLIALLSSALPLAIVYFVIPPAGWEKNGWLFLADLVSQGRFWWGMLMLFFNQLYHHQYMLKFHPERLRAD